MKISRYEFSPGRLYWECGRPFGLEQYNIYNLLSEKERMQNKCKEGIYYKGLNDIFVIDWIICNTMTGECPYEWFTAPVELIKNETV